MTHLNVTSLTQLKEPLMTAITNVQQANLHVEARDSAGNVVPITGTPTWVSSDEAIMTVDAAGQSVVARTVDGATGNVNITVTLPDGLTTTMTFSVSAGIASLVIVVDGIVPK